MNLSSPLGLYDGELTRMRFAAMRTEAMMFW
jgi:hypothetical protein